ncbi:hypothetical protein Moror_13710 [Moniliophthora roreri MCA 2997]|uniref:Uncharacterized protein n=1 Tax=Moniliophthora roreri (strain MCA 2997) TaxID=1381753 RepID=V2X9F1_MONRO|nr:hypothetical protein Moror_13710 [Moniliophthora roreri MCA 2997]
MTCACQRQYVGDCSEFDVLGSTVQEMVIGRSIYAYAGVGNQGEGFRLGFGVLAFHPPPAQDLNVLSSKGLFGVHLSRGRATPLVVETSPGLLKSQDGNAFSFTLVFDIEFDRLIWARIALFSYPRSLNGSDGVFNSALFLCFR